MLAMISPTSPRGTIPTPTTTARRSLSKATGSAGMSPQAPIPPPTSLPTIASAVSTTARASTGRVAEDGQVDLGAGDDEEEGHQELMRGWTWRSSLYCCLDSAGTIPARNAPMIAARPSTTPRAASPRVKGPGRGGRARSAALEVALSPLGARPHQDDESDEADRLEEEKSRPPGRRRPPGKAATTPSSSMARMSSMTAAPRITAPRWSRHPQVAQHPRRDPRRGGHQAGGGEGVC